MAKPNPVSVQAGMELRGRGFFRANKKSATRLCNEAVVRRLGQLARLLRQESQGKLQQADLLVELIDRFQCRPIDIARAINHRANDLSQMYWTAKTFPPGQRPDDVPYNHLLMATRVTRRFRQTRLKPLAVLREIGDHGFTQHRQVTSHFAARIRQQDNFRALQESGPELPNSFYNRCYHARFQSLLDLIPDRSIKVLHADPPYGNYRRVADGRYSGGRTVSADSDSASGAEAMAVTADLLRDWQPKLAVGGVLLLWQASGPLRPQIAQAVEQYDWAVEAVVVWDKSNVQPANFETPYSTQCEWLWILKRPGDQLLNHDNSPRGDILRFDPAHVAGDLHLHTFQKPEALMRFLISKHSYAGELIFDACGCTGSMCAAAANLGRRWVYSESHRGNYHMGANRMAQALSLARAAS